MTQYLKAELSDRDYALMIEQARDKQIDIDELAAEMIRRQLQREAYDK